MNILFTICGRAGSKGFKNKNLKELNGIPLAYYTLAAIKGYTDSHSENDVDVAVNTDSQPLIELFKAQNIIPIQFIDRKEEHAGDTAPKVEVIKHTFMQMNSEKYDVVVDLDLTSPFRRAVDIEHVIEEFSSGGYDLVFSVVNARRSPYFNMVESKDDGYYRKICQSSFTARQQAPKCYEMNASIYAYAPVFLKSEIDKTILDYRCGISVMPDYLVLDIDSEEDFQMMQLLQPHYCSEDKSFKEMIECAAIIEKYRDNDMTDEKQTPSRANYIRERASAEIRDHNGSRVNVTFRRFEVLQFFFEAGSDSMILEEIQQGFARYLLSKNKDSDFHILNRIREVKKENYVLIDPIFLKECLSRFVIYECLLQDKDKRYYLTDTGKVLLKNVLNS